MASCSVLLAVFVALSLQSVVVCESLSVDNHAETMSMKNTSVIEEENNSLIEYDQRHYHDTDSHVRVKRRNWWKLIKGGVTVINVITTVGTLVDGVLSHFYRCCLKYYGKISEICENKKKYYAHLPAVIKLGTQMDDEQLEMTNLMEYINQCNSNNKEIWLSVKLFKSYTDTIVNTLDPDLIFKFRKMLAKFRRLMATKNNTIAQLAAEKFDDEFQSMFADAETTAWSLSGYLGGAVFGFVKLAFKENKISKMSGVLNGEHGHKFRQNPRLHKVLGVTNGVQVLGLALKIKKCEELYEKSVKSLDDIRDAERKMKGNFTAMKKFHKKLKKQGWDYVKTQVTGGNFTHLLKDIANVTKNAGKQTTERQVAYNSIIAFMANIKMANFKDTFNLQKKLIKALKVASFPLKCLQSKFRLVRNMIFNCKLGAGSMKQLFQRARRNFPTFNSSDCTDKAGVGYTFFADVRKIVIKRMIRRGFRPDCIRNNKALREQACFLRDYEGLNITEITGRLKITVGQANYFLKNCPARILTRKETTQVCTLRNRGLSDKAIAKILKLPKDLLSLVQNVTGCPSPPPLTAQEITKVCQYRKLRVLTARDIAMAVGKPLWMVKAVICPTPKPLTQIQKKMICNLWRSGFSYASISTLTGMPLERVKTARCRRSG